MNRRKFIQSGKLLLPLSFLASAKAQTVAPWLMRAYSSRCPWQEGLFGWYAADTLGLANNDPVSSWTDLSGKGNTLVQASGTKQPLFKTGLIGGLPGVRFDGSNDDLICTPLSGAQVATNNSCISAVMNMTSVAGTRAAFCTKSGVSELRTDDGIYFRWESGAGGCCCSNRNMPNLFSRWIIFTINNSANSCGGGNGAYSNFYINGASNGILSDSASNPLTDQICLGARDNSSLFQAGDFAEFMMWDRALQPCELDVMWRYLSTKYSIS